MELDVNLRELHTVVSRMSPPREVTIESARAAGEDARVNGANEDNCHFSYFSDSSLTQAWEAGNSKESR